MTDKQSTQFKDPWFQSLFDEYCRQHADDKPSDKPKEWLIEGLIPKGETIFMEIYD